MDEDYGLKNIGPRLSDQTHTHTVADTISRRGYEPSVYQTVESYFTTKVNKNSKAVRDKTGWQSQIQWCKQKVDTSKHEDFNLMFTTHGKEDGIYPPRTKNTLYKEIAKAKNKDQ